MYRFSRAIYRDLADQVVEASGTAHTYVNHARVLRACEEAIERLATDRHYFAHPARTLFRDIRAYFPMGSQVRVWRVIEHYLGLADAFVRALPRDGLDACGNPLQCRASTRKGTPCQRMPVSNTGYCPSHQHLVDSEEADAALAA